MTKVKKRGALPLVDPPRVCRCTYCRNPELRKYLDERLEATRVQGLPRPRQKTVLAALAAEFGTPDNTARKILTGLCCKPWSDPWPSEPGA